MAVQLEKSRAAGRRQVLSWIAGAGAGLAGAAVAVAVPAEGTAQPPTPVLIGSWLVFVPQPDGTTFTTVQSFLADGGTITQFRSGTDTFSASVGSGSWVQTGERAFASTFMAVEYDAHTGAATGVATGQGSFMLDAAGNTWSGTGRLSFADLNGTVLNQTPVFPVRATRIQHQPLEP